MEWSIDGGDINPLILHIRPQIKACTLLCTLTISMFALAMFAFDQSSQTGFFVPNAFAVNDTGSLSDLSETLDLGTPFYMQHYQHNVSSPKSESEPNLYVNHTNDGLINGTLKVDSIGNNTETLRNNDTVYLQGNYTITTHNMDDASYNFQAIGHYGPDKSYESNGVAVFDENATGKLAFLENAVALYKVKIDADGGGDFYMWLLK